MYLRVVGSDSVIPVHIGENESNALLREINKQRQVGTSLLGGTLLDSRALWLCMLLMLWCQHFPVKRWQTLNDTAWTIVERC